MVRGYEEGPTGPPKGHHGQHVDRGPEHGCLLEEQVKGGALEKQHKEACAHRTGEAEVRVLTRLQTGNSRPLTSRSRAAHRSPHPG